MPGNITATIDVAQLVLYAFWAFFAGLIWYLHTEDKREGYPLLADRPGAPAIEGLPPVPDQKSYLVGHGATTAVAKPGRVDAREVKAEFARPSPGSPVEPTGNPMLDGVGPASWAERADVPDLTLHGDAKIVPLRVASGVSIATEDNDPRGMSVLGGDGVVAGTVKDAWVDRSEMVLRYLEVTVSGGRNVLLPMNFARVDRERKQIRVKSIFARHFADVPALRNPEQVTFLEEDKICAYYGGGYLYAHPSRMGPVL